jgi:hypothetical protein
MEVALIKQRIHELRGQSVLLDVDLAELYGVETRVLNQAVKRNRSRFPADFMFQLTKEELENLKSQFVTSSWGGSRKLPFAFTEQGVAMLSSVLKSERAIQINIAIMRAFVAMRRYALTYSELAQKIAELEVKSEQEFADINEVLKWLGEENQARADEIKALQAGDAKPDEWQNRPRIGYKK